MQLSDYNFTSVTCEKSASSLTLPNTGDNTGSIRDGLYWISRENSLDLPEISSINKVSLV
jgi:hypothetical protein